MSETPDIDFCAIMLVPEEDQEEAIRNALKENPANWPSETSFPSDLSDQQQVNTLLAVEVSRMWAPGRVLRVSFIGGSGRLRSEVKQYAMEWTRHANITFKFVDELPSDIRVGFASGAGSWSVVGTDCLLKRYQPDKPTMNFGSLHDDSSEETFSNMVLHEFGHALGCIHEHQQPNADIKWNKEVVYESYRRSQGWSRDRVDQVVFNRYTGRDYSSTPFDKDSVMLYPIPAKFTLDGFFAHGGTTLSPLDKHFIRSKYPFRKLIDKFYTGSAHTNSIRDWKHPRHDNAIHVRYPNVLPERPFVLLALNYLDFGKESNMRIECNTENVLTDRMTIKLASWADTVHYASGCSWLIPPVTDDDFQFGHWSTLNVHPSSKPQTYSKGYIRFPRSYTFTPKVIVFLDCVDAYNGYCSRVEAYPSEITKCGFYVNINSWGNGVLYRASVCWAAHSSNRRDLCSGTFSTKDIRHWDPPRSENSSSTTFATEFRERPDVFVGLTMLDLSERGGQRLQVYVDRIMPKTMDWHIRSWDDTTLYQASASYIAYVNQ